MYCKSSKVNKVKLSQNTEHKTENTGKVDINEGLQQTLSFLEVNVVSDVMVG